MHPFIILIDFLELYKYDAQVVMVHAQVLVHTTCVVMNDAYRNINTCEYTFGWGSNIYSTFV